MSEPTPPATIEPPIDTKPTVTREEPSEPKIPDVIQQQIKDMSKELKSLRKELAEERAAKDAIDHQKKLDTVLDQLKQTKNKALYEKYKDEKDIKIIQIALDAAQLTKSDFPNLIENKDKSDDNKIPVGIDPITGKIYKA